MSNSPRTREFYRPLVEDLHEAAREWRGSLSRAQLKEVFLITGLLLSVPILVVVVGMYSASLKSDIATSPASVSPQEDLMRALTERGAIFSGNANGSAIWVTLEGEHFLDRDLRALSIIHSLDSVTVIDADVTDAGLRALQLPRLRQLVLINTRVTDEAAAAYPATNGPPTVNVRLVRDFRND